MPELRRVMCVEDDADIRTVLAFSLQDVGGYTVHMCASGEAALRDIQAFAPDMLVLDVMMPGLSGPQTLQQLRDQGLLGSAVVVFLTAKAMPSELEALTSHGSTGIIVKPFDPMTLPDALQLYWQHGQPGGY
ncbi:MAG: response regulator [Aquabacterium sp.]|nr:response regulator [Aquabacterium sp.]